MSQNQSNKLDIPGKETFLFDFKFNLEAPLLPLPQIKTLPYPQGDQSFLKPCITNIDLLQSNTFLPKINHHFHNLIIFNHKYQKKDQPLTDLEESLLNETFGHQIEENLSEH